MKMVKMLSAGSRFDLEDRINDELHDLQENKGYEIIDIKFNGTWCSDDVPFYSAMIIIGN